MASAMEGFLAYDCNDDLAARLRREVEAAKGAGYDCFEFNTFDIELFYGENRVKITEAAALGYDDAELTVEEFLSALPDVPAGPRMYGRPRRVIVPTPPSDDTTLLLRDTSWSAGAGGNTSQARSSPMGHSSSRLPVLVIDGSKFDDFKGFQREFSALLHDHAWNGNLDAFNDILRGGFGTPDNGWILRWLNSDFSRAALGHEAAQERLEALLTTCHPSHRERLREEIESARRGQGPTLFDTIVDIIRVHGPGGEEGEDGVVVELL